MTQTENLKLKKPNYSEPADIEVINGNMDVIDTAYKQEKEAIERVSLGAFIECAAVYNQEFKRCVLTPIQANLSLPEVFTVRFIAPTDFKAGDKVYLAGVEYAPAYTDSISSVETGVWVANAVVDLACRTTDKKVFVGKALENKMNIINLGANPTNALLPLGEGNYRCAAWTNLPPNTLDGQASIYVHDWSVVNGKVAFGRRLAMIPYGGAIWENICVAYNWSGWHQLITNEPLQKITLPLQPGIIKENASEFWKNAFGEVTISFRLKRWDNSFFPLGSNLICVMPEDCRPAGYIVHDDGFSLFPYEFMPIVVDTGGQLNVVVLKDNVTSVCGTVSFYTK